MLAFAGSSVLVTPSSVSTDPFDMTVSKPGIQPLILGERGRHGLVEVTPKTWVIAGFPSGGFDAYFVSYLTCTASWSLQRCACYLVDFARLRLRREDPGCFECNLLLICLR